MAGKRLASKLSPFLILLLSLCFRSSYSSSCGNVHDIRCPFHLKGVGQKKCSGSSYELSCENNRTILNLKREDMHYFVEDINYDNVSVSVVDPGINKNNYSSLPLYSIQDLPNIGGKLSLDFLNLPVTFINCQTPAKYSQYMNITSISSNFSTYKYSYVVAGRMELSEVDADCQVSKIAWVSIEWPGLINYDPLFYPSSSSSSPVTNFSQLHDGMAFGFKIDWSRILCAKCNLHGRDFCTGANSQYTCFHSCAVYDTKFDSFQPLCEYNFELYLPICDFTPLLYLQHVCICVYAQIVLLKN